MTWSNSPWRNKDVVERCRFLWQSGHSCKIISATLNSEYGLSLTRNAVVGHIHRMYYPGRETKIKARAANPYRGGRKPGSRNHPRLIWDIDPNRPEPLNIPLLESAKFQCLYIEGNDALCCGHKTIGDSSWCAYHYKMVFRRAAPRAVALKEAA